VSTQLDSLLKIINQLPSAFNAIESLSVSGWIFIVFIFFGFFLNKNFFKLWGMLKEKEKQKIEKLELYIGSNDSSNANLSKVIKDIRDAYYFKMATGIYAEEKLRNALIWIHKNTSYLVGWQQINQALPYITILRDESASIRKMTAIDSIGYWYNKLTALVFFLISAFVISAVIFSQEKTPRIQALSATR
jgi:hypothetical protein